MNAKRWLSFLFAGSLLAFMNGCGPDETRQEKITLRLLTAEATRLYVELHPLRSSRLGLAGADSLLFTFGEEEIGSAIEKLARLDDRLSSLSVSGLSPRDIGQARVIIHWARGERFAFETLAIQRTNPLLYAWIAEEALEEMPSRFDPAHPGEGAAYRKRVLATAELFSNASRTLGDPAEAHARFALLRLDALAGRMDEIGRIAGKRYGTSFDEEIADARNALHLFRSRVAGSLALGARGGLILGAENLSKVFLFDELLDADPNMLIAEAERRITRLSADRASTTKRIEFERSAPPAGGVAPGIGRTSSAGGAARAGLAGSTAGNEGIETIAERLIDTLWTSRAHGASFGAPRGLKPAIRVPAKTRFAAPLPKNPYLSLPLLYDPAITAGAAPLGAPSCRPYVFISRDAGRLDPAAFRSALLAASPGLLEPSRLICEAADTVAAVFVSETWREGLRHLALVDAAERLRTTDPELYLRLLDDMILRLSRTVVALRIHTGRLTTERAAAYLVDTARMSRENAEREVLAASISPSVAWPGISMILVERMADRFAEPGDAGASKRKARALLVHEPGLPLSLIERKNQ